MIFAGGFFNHIWEGFFFLTSGRHQGHIFFSLKESQLGLIPAVFRRKGFSQKEPQSTLGCRSWFCSRLLKHTQLLQDNVLHNFNMKNESLQILFSYRALYIFCRTHGSFRAQILPLELWSKIFMLKSYLMNQPSHPVIWRRDLICVLQWQ